MYRIINTFDAQYISRTDGESVTTFPENPANTDYQQFKTDVLAGAELQDADGNVMTPEEAKQFVATLP